MAPGFSSGRTGSGMGRSVTRGWYPETPSCCASLTRCIRPLGSGPNGRNTPVSLASERRAVAQKTQTYSAESMTILEGLAHVRKRPGHVHRRHRRDRPPPPRVGGRRQLGRRGHGRLLRPHRHHAARRRRLPGHRQRPWHPDRRPHRVQDDRRRDRPHQARWRRQVRRRRLQGVRRPPRRRRVGRQRAVQQGRSSRSTATASATTSSSPTAARSRPSSRWSARRPRDRTGTTVTFWPDPVVFEIIEFAARTMLERFQMMAFLNKGLEIRFKDERPEHDHEPVVYRYAGGIIDFVKHVNATKSPLFPKVGYIEQIEEDARGRARLPVERRLPDRRPAQLRQRHRHHRGRHPRRGLPGRAHHRGQPVRQGQEPPQGEGPEPRRRGHPRGPHRHHLGAPRRAAVRGPDQGQARQPRDQDAGAAGHQREARRLARGAPDRGQQDRQEGDRRPAGPRRGPAGPRRHPPQVRARRRRHARQAQGLLEPQPPRVRAVHRRGRLRRRLGHQGPRPAHPGDPPDPRQDPQRRAGPPRQDAQEQRDPGADLGHRRRLRRRGLRRRRRSATTG